MRRCVQLLHVSTWRNRVNSRFGEIFESAAVAATFLRSSTFTRVFSDWLANCWRSWRNESNIRNATAAITFVASPVSDEKERRNSGTPWSRASVEGASVASWTDRWTDRPSTDSHQTKFHTVVDYSAVRQNKAWPSTAAAGGHSLTACINDLTLGSPKTRCQTLAGDRRVFQQSRRFTPILRSSFHA